jgi:hypothetical protein
MRVKKAVVFVSRRLIKTPKQLTHVEGSTTQTYEDSEPLIFSFDEDLGREEKKRRCIALIHHLCIRTASVWDHLEC